MGHTANARGIVTKTVQQAREKLNITVDLIPRENSNRPGTPLRASKVTIHNTDNDEPGADARAHCQYQKGTDAQRRKVSWHFTVDDHSIYQSLPLNEVGWHAGTGAGNMQSVGIEICENRGIDQEAANDRAARLTALLLHELYIDLEGNVVQHNDWSGKDCPALLRHPPSRWTAFLQRVKRYYDNIIGTGHENEHGASIDFRVVRGAAVTSTDALERILQIATDSDIARYDWRDRGRAPIGYIKGMALCFGRAYCKLKSGDSITAEIAKADSGNDQRDALSHYREQFTAAGMDNSISGPDTLRHVFVLLLGLGMRESSGNYCEGRDMSAHNTSAETAEAGLFQTSYNAIRASTLLPIIFSNYLNAPGSGFLEIFKERAHCSQSDFQNYGTEPGRDFQQLSKECPAFAVEFTAVALRHIRSHWGPLIARKAEIRLASDQLFKNVADAIDQSNLCPI